MSEYDPTASDSERLKQMEAWQRNFKIQGANVEFSNTLDHCETTIKKTPEDPVIPKRRARIHLTSNNQYGVYNGKTITGAINSALTGGLVASALGTESTSENCVFWNLAELGDSTNAIDLTQDRASYVIAEWFDIDTITGFPIYIGRIVPPKDCGS